VTPTPRASTSRNICKYCAYAARNSARQYYGASPQISRPLCMAFYAEIAARPMRLIVQAFSA
jgi:hypothetical protein